MRRMSGCSVVDAANVAIRTCRIHLGRLAELRFVLFGQDSDETWLRVAENLVYRIPEPR
jgi:hypothetical protein